MSIDCLLIIENDSPLNLAFEMLFGSDSGVDAVKSNAKDFRGLVDEVCNLKSGVVILEDSATGTEENVLADLLMAKPGMKIVIVLRDSNYIHIFRKDEVMIRSSSDFLEIIQSK